MTKTELIKALRAGQPLQHLVSLTNNDDAEYFKTRFDTGKQVIYIPDLELLGILPDRPLRYTEREFRNLRKVCYTGNDFLRLCHGDVEAARNLFSKCAWQDPQYLLQCEQ